MESFSVLLTLTVVELKVSTKPYLLLSIYFSPTYSPGRGFHEVMMGRS